MASEVGKDITKAFIKEPVKEAVREALDEEQRRRSAVSDEELHATESSDEEGGGFPLKTVLTLASVVGIVLLVRRLSNSGMDANLPGDIVGGGKKETSRTGETGPHSGTSESRSTSTVTTSDDDETSGIE